MSQAYVMTVYSSQGLIIDGDVFVYYTCGMDRANTYVASSRHKDSCYLFINNREINELNSNKPAIESLAHLMSADKKKQLAVEYLELAKEKLKQFELED
jgi:ATP-dependent exoDNAse (exonuclease V) alpha subunit